MKRISIFIGMFCIATMGFSQENLDAKPIETKSDYNMKTIFSNDHAHGAWIDVSLRYMEINKLDGLAFGAKIGYLMNHTLGMGVAGYFFGNEESYNDLLLDDFSIKGGHVGFFVEQLIAPTFPVHISIPIFAGIGGIGYSADWHDENNHNDDWDDDTNEWTVDSDVYAVFKPGIELEFNMTRHFRIATGAYYTMTTDINIKSDDNISLLKTDVLNGLSYGLTFKIGAF